MRAPATKYVSGATEREWLPWLARLLGPKQQACRACARPCRFSVSPRRSRESVAFRVANSFRTRRSQTCVKTRVHREEILVSRCFAKSVSVLAHRASGEGCDESVPRKAPESRRVFFRLFFSRYVVSRDIKIQTGLIESDTIAAFPESRVALITYRTVKIWVRDFARGPILTRIGKIRGNVALVSMATINKCGGVTVAATWHALSGIYNADRQPFESDPRDIRSRTCVREVLCHVSLSK